MCYAFLRQNNYLLFDWLGCLPACACCVLLQSALCAQCAAWVLLLSVELVWTGQNLFCILADDWTTTVVKLKR